jgi:Topoisomerase 6 subunit A/Spo11, Toprim domain
VATKKDFSGDPGGLIGDAIWSAVKPLYKEAKKQERTARTHRRTYYTPEPKVSQKEIVFSIMPRAIHNAGANFSARDLYYAARPLVYAHGEWENGKRLEYGYFSQTLLTEYQEQHGAIAGLWRDPRGSLHEPHTGGSVALGTREVASYEFPEYTFDKILYVEKEGEWPKLQAARLAERYDMAIASAKGYPVEAVRELFSRAEGGEYQLFCFHDADLDGYNIARVMRQATRRMPGYSVEVVDIGLTVEDALEMSLDPEPFSRKKDISWGLLQSLSDVARQYLYRRNPYERGVSGERFELNAILPDTARIEYIERKLEENDVRGKVIPPDDKLGELADEKYRALNAGWVAEAIETLISSEEFKKEIADEFVDKFGLDEARRHIEESFDKDRALSWRRALEEKLKEVHGQHTGAFESAVEKKLRERLAGK